MGSTKSGGKWPEHQELLRDHRNDRGALRLIQALALDLPRARGHRTVVAVPNVQNVGATERNDTQQVNQVHRQRPNAEAQGEPRSG